MNIKETFLKETLELFHNTGIEGVNADTKKQMDSLAEYLLKPIYTPKDLGLTYATIKYWESKNYLILSTPKEAEEWRRYSVIEYLWFQLLIELVDMGCTLEKAAPKLLFAFANFSNEKSTVRFDEAVPSVMVINGIRVAPFNNFLNYILLTIITRSRASIQFSKDGCHYFFQRTLDNAKLASLSFTPIFTTGINFCISDVLFNYILGLDNETQSNLPIFEEAEIEVLNLLNRKEINEISIKQNDGKIYQIESVEKRPISELKSSVESFVTGDYQEITFITNKNKNVSFTRINKQKF